jgi:DNA-binding NarL/FixJ family response regulator
MLTGYDEEVWIMDLITAGVRGYILKDDGFVNLADGVRTVYEGRHFYSQDVLDKYFDAKSICERVTEAERMLLRLLAEGYDNNQIALELCLAEKTVRKNLSVLYEKLGPAEEGYNLRVAAINKAIRLGLIKRDGPER